MGKWSHLKGELETLPPQDASWQAQINARKELIGADRPTMYELGKRLNAALLEKQRIKELETENNIEIEAAQQMLLTRFEEEHLDSIRLSDGTLLSIYDDPYPSVEDKAKFLKWVRETGQDDLLTVHYMTMSGIVKDGLQKLQPPPPGIKVWMKSTVRRYKR